MIFAALSEAADRDELLLVEGGMCRWHRRKDGVVVIREIVVLPAYRCRKLGRWIVRTVAYRSQATVMEAACPDALPANAFWLAIGFLKVGEKTTKAGGKVNLYRWRVQP